MLKHLHWYFFGICICNSHSMIRRKLLHSLLRLTLTCKYLLCIYWHIIEFRQSGNFLCKHKNSIAFPFEAAKTEI